MCRTWKSATKDSVFILLEYASLFSGRRTTPTVELSHKRKEIRIAQKHLLCKVLDGNDLEMGAWRTCKDVVLLEMKQEVDATSMGTRMEGNSPGSEDHFRENDLAHNVLKPLKKDVNGTVLHGFLWFDSCMVVNERHMAVDGSVIWFARLVAWIATVV